MAQEVQKGTGGKKNFIYIFDGGFKQKAKEEDQYAIRRTYMSGKGEDAEKKTRWEIGYNNLIGHITSIEVVDTDWKTKQLQITIKDSDGDVYLIQMETKGYQYAEMFMEKSRNIDFSKEVFLNPYHSFESKEGKKIKEGISILQDPIEDNGETKWNTKVTSYYWENNKRANGYPVPDEKEKKDYDGDDWKHFYSKCTKFLISTVDNEIKEMIDKSELPF